MTNLVLTSWDPSVQVVSLIELVRSTKQEGLLSAKREVEDFLGGKALVISVSPSFEAEVLREKFIALGVGAEIEEEN